MPVLLTLAGLVAGLALAGPASGALIDLVWTEPQGLAAPLWWAGRGALFLALVFLAAVGAPMILAGPFMDALSARVEALELGPAPAAAVPWRAAREAAASLLHTAARLAIWLLGEALLLPTVLLPFVFPALSFLWTARWCAFEWLDVPMARHLHGFREVGVALRAVRPYGLGLGSSLAALFLLPLADLLLLPVGAVAGTLLYCRLVEAGVVRREGPSGAPERAPTRR